MDASMMSWLSKSPVRWAIRGFVALALLCALWLTYDHFYCIPSGPSLPPSPPKKQFSEQVIGLNNRAMKLVDRNPEAALQLLDQALEADPEYHIGWVNKGQLLMRQKEHMDAALCMDAAARLRPRAAEYYVGKAFCLQRAKMPNEARRALMKAMSAYNYRMTEDASHHTRLNRVFVLFLLGREVLANRELDALEEQAADDGIRMMVWTMRESIAKMRHDDPWAILGLGE